MSNFKVRTDLALEARESAEEGAEELRGVSVEEDYHKDSDVKFPKVDTEDKVITLSTCTEDSANLERFVLTAVLVGVDGKPILS